MGDQRVDERVPHGEAFDWEDAEDLTALLEYELRAWLWRGWSTAGGAYGGGAGGELQARLLHGKMNELRADHVRRAAARDALAMSPEEPARVFLGGPAEGGGP
jgi:hypothetical protein